MILKLAAFSPTRTSTRPMKLRHSRSRTFLLSKLPFTNQHVTIPKRVYFSTKTTDTSESDSQQKTRSKFKSHYYLQGTITLALSLSIGVYVFNRNYPWFPGYLYQGQITDRYAVSSFVTRLPLEGNSNTNNSSETVQIRVFYPADLSKPLMSNSNAGKTEQFESNPEADSEVIKEQDRYYCRTAAIQGCCEARQSSQLYTWISHMLLGKKEHYLQLNRDILSMKFNFPLIIFSHGLYGVFDMYSTLCSDFASRGFVVFALEHEDGSAGYAEEKTSKRIIHYKRQPMASGSNTLGSDSNSDSDQQQQQDQFSDRIKIKEFRKPFLEKRCQEIEEVVGAVRFQQEKKQQQTQSEIESDTRYAKIRKVLQFTNTDQYHLIGHSFGGSTVVQYLREFNTNLNATNSRINSSNSSSINLKPIQLKSCIIMDLWSAPLQEVTADSGKINSSKQLQQYPPTLFLHSEGFSLWRKEEWNDTLQIFTQLCDNCQSDSMSEADKVLNPPLILLRDTKHHIFSDIPFWLPPSIGLVGDLVRGRESIQRLYKEYFCWKKMNEKVNCLSEKDVVLDVIYPQNQKQDKGNEVTASIQGGYYGEKRLESPKSNSNPMRFNLEKFNQDFFDKLKSSVITGSEYEKILKRRQYIADVAVDFMLKEGG